jgi:hypothetical protein
VTSCDTGTVVVGAVAVVGVVDVVGETPPPVAPGKLVLDVAGVVVTGVVVVVTVGNVVVVVVVVVVVTGAPAITNSTSAIAVAEPSVALRVTLDVPLAAGVPVTMPVAESRPSPAGSVPVVTVYETPGPWLDTLKTVNKFTGVP